VCTLLLLLLLLLASGYTPLHMACGYMQTGAMSTLLEAGADPLVKDKQGRDVVTLVENLRRSMPPSMGALQRIMALEQVAGGLTDRCGVGGGRARGRDAGSSTVWVGKQRTGSAGVIVGRQVRQGCRGRWQGQRGAGSRNNTIWVHGQ
jgi:hypothetical protein